MAGTKKLDDFREHISPFLISKISEIRKKFGDNNENYLALERQYYKKDLEKNIEPGFEKPRHYQSELRVYYDNQKVKGLERLYRSTVLIEPTTVCAAHCRWCLRGQYPVQTMKKEEISLATKWIGTQDEIDEVLITGGDPLMSIALLEYTLNEIINNSKNISIVRIASRVPFQDPERINDKMLDMLMKFKDKIRFELGTHINHPIEFWDESIKSLEKLKSVGFKIYNQNPLLRGVNDNFETLKNLYTLLRKHDIESHYLFHAIPLRGMSHHRTSIKKGLELTNKLSSCGSFSGRSKPRFCVLSDIGKIIIYEDTILKKDSAKGTVLLKSGFNIEERKKWNPGWQIPDNVEISSDGNMNVWYLDGNDK
jgi:lysine 2,3-aminomutase